MNAFVRDSSEAAANDGESIRREDSERRKEPPGTRMGQKREGGCATQFDVLLRETIWQRAAERHFREAPRCALPSAHPSSPLFCDPEPRRELSRFDRAQRRLRAVTYAIVSNENDGGSGVRVPRLCQQGRSPHDRACAHLRTRAGFPRLRDERRPPTQTLLDSQYGLRDRGIDGSHDLDHLRLRHYRRERIVDHPRRERRRISQPLLPSVLDGRAAESGHTTFRRPAANRPAQRLRHCGVSMLSSAQRFG